MTEDSLCRTRTAVLRIRYSNCTFIHDGRLAIGYSSETTFKSRLFVIACTPPRLAATLTVELTLLCAPPRRMQAYRPSQLDTQLVQFTLSHLTQDRHEKQELDLFGSSRQITRLISLARRRKQLRVVSPVKRAKIRIVNPSFG